eukprot:47431-Chlamydomonas_euryale.AAC.1
MLPFSTSLHTPGFTPFLHITTHSRIHTFAPHHSQLLSRPTQLALVKGESYGVVGRPSSDTAMAAVADAITAPVPTTPPQQPQASASA